MLHRDILVYACNMGRRLYEPPIMVDYLFPIVGYFYLFGR